MRLDIKKTGLVIAASSAFMVANAFADGHGAKVYGSFGVELQSFSSKANENADAVGGLSFVDGGNRLGVLFTKNFDGGAVKSVVGNVELGAAPVYDAGGWILGGRQANVKVNLASGGTLGLGQQNNLRVGSGGKAASWTGSYSELPRGINGARYSGLSYVQSFGMGSFGLMVGIDATDNGDESDPVATKHLGSNALDKTTLLLNLNPADGVNVQLGYDSKVGDEKTDARESSDIALNIGYSMRNISANLGYAMYKIAQGKGEINRNSLALNVSFDAGMVTPWIGYRQSEFDNKNSSGVKVAGLETETGISLGVNLSALGGTATVQYGMQNNTSGVKGADETRILAGLFYSF